MREQIYNGKTEIRTTVPRWYFSYCFATLSSLLSLLLTLIYFYYICTYTKLQSVLTFRPPSGEFPITRRRKSCCWITHRPKSGTHFYFHFHNLILLPFCWLLYMFMCSWSISCIYFKHRIKMYYMINELIKIFCNLYKVCSFIEFWVEKLIYFCGGFVR